RLPAPDQAITWSDTRNLDGGRLEDRPLTQGNLVADEASEISAEVNLLGGNPTHRFERGIRRCTLVGGHIYPHRIVTVHDDNRASSASSECFHDGSFRC